MQVGPITAVAWPANAALATGLARMAAEPWEYPGLGRRTAGAIRLIVVPDARQLGRLSRGEAPSWGVGIALPEAHTILLRADGGDPIQTLRHELAHLVLHAAVRGRLPLWFDEGYAAYAAGEWSRLDALSLNLTVARGSIPDFDHLDALLRGSAPQAEAAYALAASAVLELARRNPEGSLAPLMSGLVGEEDFETAVRRTTGLTLSRFEEEWQRGVRRRYSFAAWAAERRLGNSCRGGPLPGLAPAAGGPPPACRARSGMAAAAAGRA